MIRIERGMYTPTEKVVAVIGNASSWILASMAQEFMFIAAAICSLSTSVYMLTKLCILVRAKDKSNLIDKE